ncbi:hypothetical protein HMPREF9374_4005 [Desmospora sp. 8437]|nr:hypothetical protein HMPREF9374_4005 [Desmospora sp. 8437]
MKGAGGYVYTPALQYNTAETDKRIPAASAVIQPLFFEEDESWQKCFTAAMQTSDT